MQKYSLGPQWERQWLRSITEIPISHQDNRRCRLACRIDLRICGGDHRRGRDSKWADAYKKETGSELNYQSIGSGAGYRTNSKTVAFGASDMPLKPARLEKDGLIQWPMVMGALVLVVNIEGIKPGELTFDAETLSNIFLGKITTWDDACDQEA